LKPPPPSSSPVVCMEPGRRGSGGPWRAQWREGRRRREHRWCRDALRACRRVAAIPLSFDDVATNEQEGDTEKKVSAARDAKGALCGWRDADGNQRRKQSVTRTCVLGLVRPARTDALLLSLPFLIC
jgi:hypothetical protein